MSIEANKKLVTHFFSAVGAEWLELMHTDMTFFVAGEMEYCGMLDMESIQKLYGVLAHDAKGPFTIVPLHMIAEGDYVAVEAEGHLALTNDRIYNNHYHIVFEIMDGKIKNIREYSDTDHLRRIYDLKGAAIGTGDKRMHPLRRIAMNAAALKENG